MKKLVLLAIFATTSFLTTLPAHAAGPLAEAGWGKLPERVYGSKEPKLAGGNGGATGRPNFYDAPADTNK